MLGPCAQCGAPLADGATVCAQCGTTAAVPAATPAPVPFAPTFSMEPNLEGIGGWLILVAIGLGISPLRSMHGIYVDLHVMYASQFQEFLSQRPGVAGLILYEATTNSIFLIALAFLNYLFYFKKRNFPLLMIGFLAAQAVLILIDDVAAIHYFPRHPPTAAIQSIVVAALWIPYYLCSSRVKATFVR